MLDHARGFLLGQVQAVLPQVAVFQAAVFREFFLVGHHREQAGIAAHQAFPGIDDAVVRALDVGAEVDRVTEQRSLVALHFGLVDAQQGMAEHRGRAVQVGRREDHHRAVGRDILEPLLEPGAVRRRQSGQAELVFQPAGAGRVDALSVCFTGTGRGVQGLYSRRQFMVRMFIAIGGEEELPVADIAAPAAELGGFVMAQGYPERVVGQLLQTLWVDLRRGGQRGADTQRQPGKAFEHRWQLNR
ncbi:hypothetical protein D3C81_1191270 [compost metagenome]